MVLNITIIIITSCFFTYLYIILFTLDKFNKNNINVKQINRSFINNYIGALLIINQNELLKNIVIYYKIYKNIVDKEKKVLTIIYEDSNRKDLEILNDLRVEFVPCVVIINDESKEYIIRKVDEYLK